MFNAGVKNTEITDMISKVAEAYDVRLVEGVLSHQMKRHVIDANKVIIAKATTSSRWSRSRSTPSTSSPSTS